MPRFLHTADLHLNAQRRRFPHYLVRGQWVLQAISDTARAYNCDCIVVAGDVFDQTNLTIAERQLLSDWLGHAPRPVIMVSGNHDNRSRTIGDTCLSYLTAPLKLQMHTIHDGYPTVVVVSGCAWLLLPYYGWSYLDFRLIVESLVRQVRQQDAGIPIVAVMHEAVEGCQTDSGEVLPTQIKLTEDLGVDYWALGDIHLGQDILPNAYYCGSPHQITFGESPDRHVLIVDTDTPTEVERVPLASPYPLVALDDVPREENWPLFGVFRGDIADVDGKLPDCVVYEPQRSSSASAASAASAAQQATVPLLYGLEDKLIQQGRVATELIPRTMEYAVRMEEELSSD